MLEEFFLIKSYFNLAQVCRGRLQVYTEITGIHRTHFVFCLHTLEKSYLRYHPVYFKIREKLYSQTKDTTFDYKIAKFDTRENFRLYGNLCVILWMMCSIYVMQYRVR